MKQKISITLSSDVLAKIDRGAETRLSRSAFIEGIVRAYFQERKRQSTRQRMKARDLKRINAAADQLNAEAKDVLSYQS